MAEIGPEFGGYILEERIASGGMAEVFLARASSPEGFEKKVAVKRILEHLSDQKDFRTMFLDEARLVAKLNHPNIVQLFDLGEAEGRLFLAMEYIDGHPLTKLINRARYHHVQIPQSLAAFICAEVCLGLEYAHDFEDEQGQPLNIIHRDISPQNIMLTKEGLVKIVDFGIAKAASNVRQTQRASIKGKLSYMSPEQALARIALDRRSDVYSTGVVLYEVLIGELPHKASNVSDLMRKIVSEAAPDPRRIRPKLHADLARIVRRALERNRSHRYQDCREFRRDLLGYLRNLPKPVDSYDLKDFMEGKRLADAQAAHPIASADAAPMHTVAGPDEPEGQGSTLRWLLFVAGLLCVGLLTSALFLFSEEEPAATQAQPLPFTGARPATSTLRMPEPDIRPTPAPPADPVALTADPTPPQAPPPPAEDKDTPEPRPTKRPAKTDKPRKQMRKESRRERAARRTKKQRKAKAEKLKRLGERAFRAGRYDGAVDLYEKALKLAPKDYELYRLIGSAHAANGKPRKSMQYFRKYVTLCPNCAHARAFRPLTKESRAAKK